jgi:hypothetical protein
MVGHPEDLEVFPCPTFQVPKIFDSGATKIGTSVSFIETTYFQGETSCVEDERVAKNGLSENLCVGCRFGLCYTNACVKPRTKDALPE